jgi:hypothetical protein
MFQFLVQPYPREPRNLRRWLLTSAGAGLFVALFLIIFQPFGSAEWNDPRKIYLLAGYGVVTFVFLFTGGLLFPYLFKNFFDEKNWTVGREILWNVVIILFIGFGNLLYKTWTLGDGYGSIMGWLGITAAIGIIPSTVITLLSYIRLLRRHTTTELHIGRHHEESGTTELPQTIIFIAENEKDTLVVSVNDLLFIESADNYSEIVFVQHGKSAKVLLRGSLSSFEEQAHHPDVVRCHRSYVVNLQQVESISGNAQGYKLQLKNYATPVPVARRYRDLVTGYFKR